MRAAASYGSNSNRCSQSRKVSIGILAEPSPTGRLRSTNEDVLGVPTAAEFNAQKGGCSTKGLEATATVPTEAREQLELLYMKRSTHQSTPSGTASKNDRNCKEPDGVKGASLLQPVHLFSNPSTFLSSVGATKGNLGGFVDKRNGKETEDAATGEYTKEKLGGFVDKRNGKETEDAATGEELVVASAQEIHKSDRRMVADKGEMPSIGKTEGLRMKLMELFGNVTSPTKHNLQPLEEDRTSPQPTQIQNQMNDIATKPRKCSDTIETDSESPDCTNKRPVTRTLARKRALSKMQLEKLGRTRQSGPPKPKPEKQNIPSEEGLPVGLQGTSNLRSRTFTRRKNAGVQVHENKGKIKEVADKNQKFQPSERSLLSGSNLEGMRKIISSSLGKHPLKKPAKVMLDKQEDEHNQPGTSELPERNGRLSSGNVVDPQHDLKSLKVVKRKLPRNEPRKRPVQQNENLLQQVTNENQNLPPPKKQSSHRSSRGGLAPLHPVTKGKNTGLENSPVSANCIEQPVARKLGLQEDISAPAFQVNQKAGSGLPPHEVSQGSSMGRLHRANPVINDKSTSLNTIVERKSLEQQRKLSCRKEVSSPVSSVNRIHKGDLGQSSLKDFMNTKNDAENPKFGRSPNVGGSPGSLPEEVGMEQGACIFKFENFAAKVSLNRSKNETRKLQDSPSVRPVPHMKEKDAVPSSPSSSTDDRVSGNSEEDFMEKEAEEDASSPENVPIEKPKFMLRKAKRLRSYKDTPYEEENPASLSPKGTSEINSMQEPVALDVEDGLTSAVGMLAMALEKLRNKVKLVTSKKSSEILASVAEEMHAQFHSLESQIQTDTSKLTTLSKQKRKRLETEFQEQEEQLKRIHDNFRKEINELLEGCKGTIEGLEGSHTELKGILEKQKASHRKLLVKAQEAIDTQLQDAKKRITSINKSARDQMQQLKLVIAECLEGVVMS